MFIVVSHALATVIRLPMLKILKAGFGTHWICGKQVTDFKMLSNMQTIVKVPFPCPGLIYGTTTPKLTRRCCSQRYHLSLNGAEGVISNVFDYTNWVRQFLDPAKEGTSLGLNVVADISTAHMLVQPSWHPYTPTRTA
jgi:hypothetical protein